MRSSIPQLYVSHADCRAIDSGIAFDRRTLFQMFENIKSLRLEPNINGTIVIKGMISTEGEFLQFQDDGKWAT